MYKIGGDTKYLANFKVKGCKYVSKRKVQPATKGIANVIHIFIFDRRHTLAGSALVLFTMPLKKQSKKESGLKSTLLNGSGGTLRLIVIVGQ